MEVGGAGGASAWQLSGVLGIWVQSREGWKDKAGTLRVREAGRQGGLAGFWAVYIGALVAGYGGLG